MRTRSVRVIPTALIAGIALALAITTPAALAASSRPAEKVTTRRASTVTLATGDRVRITGTAKKPDLLVQPAATSGPGRVLITRRMGSQTYVLPAVAEPYLGRFLDPGLFDVTRIKAALKANGHLPVRISYHGSKPSVPGVTVTSASAGVARGYLTPKSAPAFGRALTAQWKADSKVHWPRRTTLFGDVTKVTADIPGSPAATPKFPMFTLVIKVKGPDGKPQPDGFIGLLNVDDGAKYVGFVEIVDGEARVSVPKGNYSAVGDDFEYNEAADTSTFRVTTIDQYQVTGAGQTLTIDHRKATERPSATVPKKTSELGYTFEWDRTDATGDDALGDGYFLDAGTDFLVAPAKPATVGTVDVSQSWQLAGPGTSPAYTYDLAAVADRIPASLHYTFTPADLGTVASSYHGDATPKTGGILRYAQFPSSFGGGGTYQYVTLGTSRNEYVGAVGGTPIWTDELLANYDSYDDPGFVDGTPRKIPAGTTQKAVWLRGPLGAAIPKQAGSDGYCYACRTSKDLSISLAPFTDSTPDHYGTIFGAEDGLPVARFRFYKNSKLVSDQDDYLGGEFAVPTAKATYKAVLDIDRRLQEPNQSTQSHTELTFKSAKGSGGTLPSSWYCDSGSTSSCRVLPILQAKVALPTSLNGKLPADSSTVTVTVARAQHAPASTVKSATLEYRPAGWDWIPVDLKSLGAGKYSGVIDNTGFDGSNVDVRLTAADKGGSSFEQTVLRAYTVAGS